MKKYTELWDGLKIKIVTVKGAKNGEYDNHFMKIKFDTDYHLALNKPLKLGNLIVIIRSVFEEDG